MWLTVVFGRQSEGERRDSTDCTRLLPPCTLHSQLSEPRPRATMAHVFARNGALVDQENGAEKKRSLGGKFKRSPSDVAQAVVSSATKRRALASITNQALSRERQAPVKPPPYVHKPQPVSHSRLVSSSSATCNYYVQKICSENNNKHALVEKLAYF